MANVRVRLRTQNGDLGPLQQTASETIGDLKRRLVLEWSKLTTGEWTGSQTAESQPSPLHAFLAFCILRDAA